MAEVAVIENQRYHHKAERAERRREEKAAVDHVEPVGLGITARKKTNDAETTAETPPPTQAPVVVNVGTAGSNASTSTGGDVIDRLAAFVVTGNDFDRDVRLRTAVNILRSGTTSDEERKVLAARLDEAIAAKTNKRNSEGNGVVRAARVAFDKLADILK